MDSRGKWIFRSVLVVKALIVFITLLLLIQSNSAAFGYLFTIWGIAWIIYGSQITLVTFVYENSKVIDRKLLLATAYVQLVLSVIFTLSYISCMSVLLYKCPIYESATECGIEKIVCTTAFPSALTLTVMASIWLLIDLVLAILARFYWTRM